MMPLTADEHELRAWIRLSLEPDLGPARIRQLLSVFGLPQNICTASTGSLARHLDPVLATRLRQAPDAALQDAIEQTLGWLDAADHHVLTLADPLYPQALLDLTDSPPLLYAHGRLELLKRPMIAIVGARHATPEGTGNAHAFAQHLALQGWCVVSGLANGIDGAAHEGALDAGPQGAGTVAVLGTGIDLVYPAGHRPLAHRIAAQGLMLSEFPLGTRALPYHFPRRNRLVAALARGVLVVEAAARSGSLITARLAGELGREVFAIPGSIHSPLSRGCHALIRQGAKLVESGQDIIEELRQESLPGLSAPQRADEVAGATPGPQADPPDEASALLNALGYEPVDTDALQARTGWAIGHLMGQLTLLEVSGRLVRQPDGRYRRLA